MTNAGFTSLDQYRDLESINLYHQRVDEAKVMSSEDMLAGLKKMSRDNARTPMQWDDSKYAGFTAEYAPTEPWISVNENCKTINAAAQVKDFKSVFAFYKKLIDLRHNNLIVAAGEWNLVDIDSEEVYAYTRTIREADGFTHTLLIGVNMTSNSVKLPPQMANLVHIGAGAGGVILSNYDESETTASLVIGKLSPWEAFVYQVRE